MMIFITSVPKAGTHLLATVIEGLTGSYPVSIHKPKYFAQADFASFGGHSSLSGHFRLEYIAQSQSLATLVRQRKVLVLIRDPRDVCNSMVHYLESSHNPEHKSIAPLLHRLSHPEKIKVVAAGLVSPVTGFRVPGLNVACDGFIDIGDAIPGATLIRFEDFFDGSVAARKISGALDVDVATAQRAIDRALGSDTKTLRVGKPQAWRTNFDESLISYMNSHYGLLIHKLGYRLR